MLVDNDLQPPDRPRPTQRWTVRAHAWIAWFGVGRLIAGAVAIVAVGAASWWLFRAAPPPAEAGLPMAARPASSAGSTSTVPTSSSSAGSSPPPTIVVHVSGQVGRPGVVSLDAGARVTDAIAAAGGPTADAEVDQLNLAMVLVDGSKVHVPAPGEMAVVAGSPSAAPSGPLDLNTATAAQLDELPGVGPATAAAIIAYRAEHGPFSSVDALGEVRGIGPAKLDALRSLVTV